MRKRSGSNLRSRKTDYRSKESKHSFFLWPRSGFIAKGCEVWRTMWEQLIGRRRFSIPGIEAKVKSWAGGCQSWFTVVLNFHSGPSSFWTNPDRLSYVILPIWWNIILPIAQDSQLCKKNKEVSDKTSDQLTKEASCNMGWDIENLEEVIEMDCLEFLSSKRWKMMVQSEGRMKTESGRIVNICEARLMKILKGNRI